MQERRDMSTHTTPGAGEAARWREADSRNDAGSEPPRRNVIGPIIAGARARGVADAFELLGEAAILLDFSGAVLHVGASAHPLMGCALCVVSDHLAPAGPRSAPALQSLLEEGLSEASAARLEADLPCAETGMRQRVRLYRVDDAGDPRQLLHSVLVLEPPRRVRRAPARGKGAPAAAERG
jgi:hypothetical protein